MSIRDLRNKSRLSLHRAMSVPAVYHDLDAGTTTDCTVREHSRTQMFGDMAGFDYAPAERVETVPKIIALAAEVSPARGGIFAVAPGEVYEVEKVFPPDGISVTCEVTKMTASEIAAVPLTFPGAP